MNYSRAGYRFLLASVASLPLMAGCNRDDGITSYSAPKDPARAVTASAVSAPSGDGQALPADHPPVPGATPVQGSTGGAPATPPAAAAADSGDPQWTVPATWEALPLGMMDFARFATSDEAQPLPVTVTQARGSMLGNVNRWEGQLGLQPTPEANLAKVVHETKVNGAQAFDVDLKSADGRRMLVMIMPQGERAWFFKLSGPADKVAAQKANFDAFTQSVRFGGPTVAAPGPVPGPVPSPVAPAEPATDAPFTFATPAGWTALPLTAPGAMGIRRVAAFSAGNDAGTAEVTVIPLPPGSGDLAANLNRWRGQVGLPPGGEGYEPKKVSIDGMDALLIDLTGPAAGEGKAKRMIMAVRTDAHTSWFFKILGPADVVSSQQANFESFVKSIKFKTAGE